MQIKNKKGFTLIELLIVIGILAVLSTATVLMLNPAQMLAETRDTQRMNDLSTLATAISLMQATAITTPAVLGGGTFSCWNGTGGDWASSVAGATKMFTTGAGMVEDAAHSAIRAVNGTGWMAAKLTDISGGSPIGTLPSDPTNSIIYNYQYTCSSGTTLGDKFEIDANLESTKYTTGATNKEINTADGGSSDTVYETGTILTL